MWYKAQKVQKYALYSQLQALQILKNDDEVENWSLSSFLLVVVVVAMARSQGSQNLKRWDWLAFLSKLLNYLVKKIKRWLYKRLFLFFLKSMTKQIQCFSSLERGFWGQQEIFREQRVQDKGQLISKGLFGFFNSPKKRTKTFCPSRLGQKLTFSSSFLRRIGDTLISFRGELTFDMIRNMLCFYFDDYKYLASC